MDKQLQQIIYEATLKHELPELTKKSILHLVDFFEKKQKEFQNIPLELIFSSLIKSISFLLINYSLNYKKDLTEKQLEEMSGLFFLYQVENIAQGLDFVAGVQSEVLKDKNNQYLRLLNHFLTFSLLNSAETYLINSAKEV
ncbi:MAG: hypothetical protein N2043_01550 [Ignavibacterium sp.]|nr:hypothetical protein [Ignavibacterium sp.]